jgi:hypothetical protein
MLLLNMLGSVSSRRAGGALLALLLTIGCAGPASGAPRAAEATPATVRVTVLLFSGRPNPNFDLAPAVALERLAPRLKATRALDAAGGDPVIPGVLGYNGIVVENGAGVAGLPRVMIVYRDRVEVRDGKTSLRLDAGRELETALLKLAQEQQVIDEKALEWIGRK